jgi:molybdate transport system ATP-binding protein
VQISLQNASLSLNHRQLLVDIWLEIKKGDVLCVLGANGSGKSTLLKLLAGQHWQTSGKRLYHFTKPPRESPIGAPIALVAPEMQERYQRLQHDQSVLEVLSTGFAQTDFLYTPLEPAQQQTLLGLAERLQLVPLLEQSFFTLSKGQMRQVLLARAMLGQPQVLLLDEFFSGVDKAAKQRLRQIVQHFLAQGGTLVYTTHRAEEPFVEQERVFEVEGGSEKREKRREKRARRQADDSRVAFQDSIEGGAGRDSDEVLVEVLDADVFLGRLEDDATAVDGHKENTPQRILERICFRLCAGQHWLVTGHNGAGKSTFAKLLRGDVSPALGGVVRFFGRESVPIWERHTQIALVSSDIQYAHRVEATGFEIIASGFFGGIGWHGELLPQQTERVLQLAAALEVGHLLESNARYVSQGELRKLLLARALVTTPQIVILDEAFDYLDANSRALVWRVLLVQASTFVVIAHREEDKPPFAVQHLEFKNGAIVN